MSADIRYTSHLDGRPRPYSAAAVHNGLAFVCGQVPVDDDGSIPSGMAAQTVAVINNLERVLLAAGSSLDHLLQVAVFLADLSEFDAYNAAYVARLGDRTLPPRTTVQVAGFRGAKRLEITAIAAINESMGTNTEERS